MVLYRISKREPIRQPLTNKCIIIDIDETLVRTSENCRELIKMKPFSSPNLYNHRHRLYSFSLEDHSHRSPPTIWGITRPHTEDFLLFCFGYFEKVCIWSAGIPEYVEKMVDHLFPPGYMPDIVYTREHCHYTEKNALFKPIEKMGESIPGMTLSNTFILDDLKENFIKNPDNGILIPPFKPRDCTDESDHALLDLIYWLQLPGVIEAEDVRTLDKSDIFV